MTPTTVNETIKALDELFDSPERWTKRALARDKNGVATYPWKNDAVCWCLGGGVYKVLGIKAQIGIPPLVDLVWGELRKRIDDENTAQRSCLPHVGYFNDHPDTDFEKLKSILK